MRNRLFLASCWMLWGFLAAMALPLAAPAQQTGVITGRVITEDGANMPNVTVTLNPVLSDPRDTTGRRITARTDQQGRFRFTDLPQRLYSLFVSEAKGYIRQPPWPAEGSGRNFLRLGEDITVTMIRGGAIMGRVTNLFGDPLAAAPVSPILVRDAEGAPVQQSYSGRTRYTDDRGIYRLYGLQPGTYIVALRGSSPGGQPSQYDGQAPTYHPSSPRETAAEVTLASGGEVAGIDIRHRGERGQIVSGTITGGNEPARQYTGTSIDLYEIKTRFIAGSTFVRQGMGENGFAIHGVKDGEYEILARRGGYDGEEAMVSLPRQVSVKGADISGIELKLIRQAAVAGKFVLERPDSVCDSTRKSSIEEMTVALRRDLKASGGWIAYQTSLYDQALNDKGEFEFRSIDSGRYFFQTRIKNENWFLKSITAPAEKSRSARAPGLNLGRSGIALQPGESLTGVVVAIADGAASLDGKRMPRNGSPERFSRTRVHLVPAEPTAADDVLRYAETLVRADGSYVFTNLSPGRYLLLALSVPEDEPVDRPPLPAAFDPIERTKLRREAESRKMEIDLKPCQRMKDVVVGW